MVLPNRLLPTEAQNPEDSSDTGHLIRDAQCLLKQSSDAFACPALAFESMGWRALVEQRP